MCKYDELLAEYDGRLFISERSMINDGLYGDGCIWIRGNMTCARKVCILAEEIGHYETSYGNILDQKDMNNVKQEVKARRWAFEKLISEEDIRRARDAGCREVWEIAEFLDLDEDFVRDALKHFGILDV